jgi:glycosyltransferase involved in cell wall biosynthesis
VAEVRILHLNNEKTWRGGERQTLLLAAGLKERGVTSVIGCRPGGLLDQQAQAEWVATLPVPGNNLSAALALTKAARAFDLVHCHTGRGHSLAALTAGWHRKPFLVTRRVDFLPSRNWFNRFKFRRAARIVCISQFIANQLADWGVPRERLTVIPSSVPPPDAKLLTPQHCEAVRARLGIAPGAKLVGNIAALVGHKDHATLIRAAKIVTERRHDVQFVIIGDGELKRPLLELRQRLGMEEQVLMPGFIPQAEQCLPAFEVLAMSSCMEGLGSVVLDAFAAGVPVAATAGGALPEIVRHEETGLLAPIGDAERLAEAILRLLGQPELVREICNHARTLVAGSYSVSNMVAQYHSLYTTVLNSRSALAESG